MQATMTDTSSPDPADPVAWLRSALAGDPQRPFLRLPEGKTFTYRDLAEISGRLAAAMAKCGVAAGDRVAVQVEKSAEAFMLYVACLRLGAILVPLNTAYTLAELAYFIGDAEPSLIVARPADRDALVVLAGASGAARVDTMGTSGDGSLMTLAANVGPD